jgi:hypothetical protein
MPGSTRVFRWANPFVLAAAVLGSISAADAQTPTASARLERIHLDTERGWLDQASNSRSPSKLAPAFESAIAERAAIIAAARRAFEGDGKVIAAAGDAVVVHATRYGPYVAQFRQRVDDIEVYGARVNVLLDRELNVRAITGGHSPHGGIGAPFRGDPLVALRSAAGVIDGMLSASAMREVRSKTPYTYFEIDRSPSFIPLRPATVKPIWYPAKDALLPAYKVEITGRQPGVGRLIARSLIVSAADGRLLSSNDLVHDLQPFGYRVFADADGHPYVDPYGYTNPYPTRLPSGYLPSAQVPMNLLEVSHSDVSTGDPWLADDATETSGNNVDAFFNADIIDEEGYCAFASDEVFRPEEGDFRAHVSEPHRFDYSYDANDTLNDYLQCNDEGLPTPIPTNSAQLNAKIVQAFYATNWLHDLFYDLGYDETAGNMQVDNRGRGGLEGDPLLVSAGFTATFTLVSEDDGNPNGALFLGANLYSLSNRDVSALDFGVLAHEWSHTMFGRLTRMSYTGQQGALNEGIADFVGLLLSVRAADRNAMPDRPPFYGNYAIGAYMNRDYDYPRDPYPAAGSPGYPDDSYYHGIRRFPHSADLAINPLTFKSIGMDHPLPDSLHANDWKLRALTNAEIHTAGEVWTEALWQCSRGIIAAAPAANFEQARNRFLANLVASLKLIPADADYAEARNALLFAIRADNEADYRRCRTGFSERGMGAGAVAPDRYSIDLRGAIESFDDVENAISIIDATLVEGIGSDGDGVLDRGESGHLRVTIQNSGFSPLGGIRVSAAARTGDFTFPHGREASHIALAAGERYAADFDVSVRSSRGAAELPVLIDVQAQRFASVQAHTQRSFRVNYNLVRDSFTDTLAAEPSFAADWTSALGEFDAPDYCYVYCGIQWDRGTYQGRAAYVIGDLHAAIDAHLSTLPFRTSATDPLRIILRHDYAFDRLPMDRRAAAGSGTLEVSVDGGEWTPADSFLVAGSSSFNGNSEGWRTDTLDFGTSLAGHQLQFRLHADISPGYFEYFSHWAIGRIDVKGALEPMFSRMVTDTD